ncbi:DUF4838 domain-containing protein [Snuella sedimenti]|uniref:DUF4838 domain-containing protein n=1 Tax=Snuella sedimenti TaxID=2798802 RepID=A0A8J7IGZ6_9FLAO|nr:DUF4838 domain-containing protein [Snuella sedimenti]MBJ6367426.1 DUF4838 domain-containing protein [Snuella sedimenti]
MKNTVLNHLFVCFFAVIIVSCTSSNKLELVTNGEANYEIVVLDNASKKSHGSAEILQNYIRQISGVNLAIVSESAQSADIAKIYVGTPSEENIEEHAIHIYTDKDNLIITGGSDLTVRQAVYEFLEVFLNCKWYAPDAEAVPNNKIIALNKPIDYKYTPEITTRTVHSRLFYENPDFADKHKVTTEAFPYYVPTARVHTFHKFVPEEVFYKTHPEYFALRGNKRLPTQLCLTNEEVYNIVRDSVAALFDQFPEASVISVSQNDNQQYCTCEHCKAIDAAEGSPSGTMIQFVNKIAADYPDKTVSTLAYQYTRKPSKTRPLDNVLITLCSIECDRSGPIEEKCVDFANDLKGWKELTENIRIWDYTTQFTNFLAPFPNIYTLQPNIKFFRENHARWIFEQHSSNPSELFELRSYIMAKLLWNPDRNMDELITEFTNGYYEEAGVYIKQYVDLIHDKIQEDNNFFLFLYGDPSQAFSSFLNSELLATYDGFFNKAEEVVAQNNTVLKRVKEARLSVDYAILEAYKKNLDNDFSMVLVNADDSKMINPDVVKRLERFYQTCKGANITLMNEMRFTVDEYYANYKNTMTVATQPNKALGKKVTLLTKPKKYANEDSQVLTDGALGGNSFYANWLGFEGNHLEAVIDLEEEQSIRSISTAFLQVTNHVVFFPKSVTYYYSNDNEHFYKVGTVVNDAPLSKTSKINDIKYFELEFPEVKARYIKIIGENRNEPPYWHHAAGLPSWIFADEVIVN